MLIPAILLLILLAIVLMLPKDSALSRALSRLENFIGNVAIVAAAGIIALAIIAVAWHYINYVIWSAQYGHPYSRLERWAPIWMPLLGVVLIIVQKLHENYKSKNR